MMAMKTIFNGAGLLGAAALFFGAASAGCRRTAVSSGRGAVGTRSPTAEFIRRTTRRGTISDR